MTENNERNNIENSRESATEGQSKSVGVNTSAAQKDGTAGVYVHKFKRPFEYENRKYETMNFYFENLTGRDMLAIETEMQANNDYALAPEISRNFQCKMASRAANIGSDVLEALPLPDFNKITNAARSFLLSTGY